MERSGKQPTKTNANSRSVGCVRSWSCHTLVVVVTLMVTLALSRSTLATENITGLSGMLFDGDDNNETVHVSRPLDTSLSPQEDSSNTSYADNDDCPVCVQSLKSNITKTLDQLLNPSQYDRQLRPGFTGPPTTVYIDIMIRSIGPISEEDMLYSFDCYFRQNWFDNRLAFHLPDTKELQLSIHTLSKIWKPDTFFFNGKMSHLHTITVPNRLLRIRDDGRVLLSTRLTIQAGCPMSLENYPIDTQICPLHIGSFGYSKQEVEYSWKHGNDRDTCLENCNSVVVEDGVTLAQYDLQGITAWNETRAVGAGEASILSARFYLKRSIGYYCLQIYIPCYMIVAISWISFWINREATPARVTLGITTILTATTIGLTGREGLPKVAYSTALDVFLLKCFVYVFAALVEFAAVNYFTKTPSAAVQTKQRTETKAANKGSTTGNENTIGPHTPLMMNYGPGQMSLFQNNEENVKKVKKRGRLLSSMECLKLFLHCLTGDDEFRNQRNTTAVRNQMVSTSQIDTASRIFFPASFLALTILYWTYYR